ncbi:cytochrome P450 81Q32 [Beta vulgaris subsp. vulgaris]|uniref:cytochrome P450 81Q32 n=1 Tax=Beta vulgaris subsp. vulgaris TaxID=3555 RepID=UPI002546F1F7|nr:cytochrome P450 81Q32 [Beta vulgaris subsp. vulgaris]
MDNIILFTYVALFLATYFTYKHVILPSKHKNMLPPSPFLSFPIIGHLYLFKKPLHRSLARVAARHGPILYLRFGSRSVVLLSSPSIVEECLVLNNVFMNRPRLLPGKYNGNNFTSIAWAPYGAHWKNLRRIAAAEILSPQRLQILSKVRANVARSFVRRMMKLQSSSENGVVEMKSVVFGLTLDNMMKMVIGKSNYDEGCDEGTEFCTRFEELVGQSFSRSGVSNLEDFLPFLKWFRVLLGSNEEILNKTKEEKDEIMKALLKEHRDMEKEGSLSEDRKKSMLHVLLSLQKEDPHYYTDELIRYLILALFQGGTDTSSATLTWAMSLLLNNPEILTKARDEIDINVSHERFVEESDKTNLPYIQCIVNETLRMYPTGPLGLPRESIDDCQVQEYHIPKGSMLVYNIWAIHNDPKNWEEPRKFKPERFLGVEGNRLGYKFLPFGTGRRVCPGEHLAGKVVWLAMAILIQCFEWERVGEELVDMKEAGGVSLTKLEPLQVKCRPRLCMMNLLSQL